MLENEIYNSLNKKFDELKVFFYNQILTLAAGIFIDNLLAEETALKISNKFPSTDNMRYLNSHREKNILQKILINMIIF